MGYRPPIEMTFEFEPEFVFCHENPSQNSDTINSLNLELMHYASVHMKGYISYKIITVTFFTINSITFLKKNTTICSPRTVENILDAIKSEIQAGVKMQFDKKKSKAQRRRGRKSIWPGHLSDWTAHRIRDVLTLQYTSDGTILTAHTPIVPTPPHVKMIPA